MSVYDICTEYEIDMKHRTANEAYEAAVFSARPSVMLRVTVKRDGNMWCALYGPNLQEGICGFGKSPEEACADFDRAWKERLP